MKKFNKNFNFNSIYRAFWWPTREWVQELLHFPFLGFLNRFKFGKDFYINWLKLRFLVTKKPVFGLIEVLVTSRCTLNCKHCNTRIPEFTNKTHVPILKFEDFKNDLDKLLAVTDYINILGFVGGEPLLANDLGKMVHYAASKKQIKQVFIATNATILPNEDLIQAMRNRKVAVQLSDYSHVKIYKPNVTVKYREFKEILLKNHINFNGYQEKRNATTWFSLPKVFKDKQKDSICKNQWADCVQICNIISNGYLLPCTMSVHIFNNLDTTQEINNEVIDIRHTNNSKELLSKLIKYLSIPYSSFCHYCHFEDIQQGLPCGEQIEEKVEV